METPTSFGNPSNPVHAKMFEPSGESKRAAVVIAYGTQGMDVRFGPAIKEFAQYLAAHGYLTMIPDYLGHTGTAAGLEGPLLAFATHVGDWVQVLRDAMAYAAGRSDVEDDRIGLLGFSMGGHLALRAAFAGPGPKAGAVVDFFAPINQQPWFSSGLGGDLSTLPPVQIHHGTADGFVDISQSKDFEAALKRAGKQTNKDLDACYYPDQGHPFQSPAAVADSQQRTREFFDRHIGGTHR